MDAMTVAAFKDLCMDAGDALSQARFWASVLGASPVDRGDGSARLDPAPGRSAGEVVWIDPVPEPRTGKTRVHLDLRLAEPGPAAILRAGATVVREPGEDPWWVLADPEGNEFCAFPPNPAAATPPGVFELVVDCGDAWAQANWWADVTGGKAKRPDEGSFAWVEAAAGFPWRAWVFAEVPEPKVVKNRVHWDVDLSDQTPDALVEAGAVVLRDRGGDVDWWVLADPEGNEFCGFPPAE
jgi:catechol 2,3-dioxygenase-like lactoylglutathione lyase family enzyme